MTADPNKLTKAKSLFRKMYVQLVTEVSAHYAARKAVDKNFSIKRFAESVGLNNSAVSRLMGFGTTPTLYTVAKLAAAFDLEPKLSFSENKAKLSVKESTIAIFPPPAFSVQTTKIAEVA